MIETILTYEEGYRAKPYIDSEGYPTVGKGTKIGPKGTDISLYQFEVTEKIADLFLEQRLSNKRQRLMKMQWYVDLNSDRQEIILSMAYQMGIHGVLKFQNMIKAAKAGLFDEMADEALDSKWARSDSPERALRHSIVLRTGRLDSVKEYS